MLLAPQDRALIGDLVTALRENTHETRKANHLMTQTSDAITALTAELEQLDNDVTLLIAQNGDSDDAANAAAVAALGTQVTDLDEQVQAALAPAASSTSSDTLTTDDVAGLKATDVPEADVEAKTVTKAPPAPSA